MNKLVEEITKDIKKERENKELEVEKQNIRAMLCLIEDKEKRATKLAEETQELKNKLEKKDYSPVKPINQNYITFYRVGDNGMTWTYNLA